MARLNIVAAVAPSDIVIQARGGGSAPKYRLSKFITEGVPVDGTAPGLYTLELSAEEGVKWAGG